MPRENKTRYALLGMLSYKPMNGYEMKKMSDQSIGHFWNENFGNIYPVLKKLEAEGLVSMVHEKSDGGPSRKTYTISTEGRKALAEWLTKPPDVSPLREELLLQIFFGQWTDPGLIREKIRREDERCSSIIRELETIRDHMDSGHETEEVIRNGVPYWRHTVEFGLHYYEGIQNWCIQTLKEMEG